MRRALASSSTLDGMGYASKDIQLDANQKTLDNYVSLKKTNNKARVVKRKKKKRRKNREKICEKEKN